VLEGQNRILLHNDLIPKACRLIPDLELGEIQDVLGRDLPDAPARWIECPYAPSQTQKALEWIMPKVDLGLYGFYECG
jgi:hypothetical protein